MADTSVAVTPGAGANIDFRTESTNGDYRQVIVIGDPSSNNGVAPVDGTNGLSVDNKTLPPGAATETTLAALNAKVLGKAATATRTQVNDSATDVLILAANSNRLGAMILNDSSSLLYLGLGTATVTATDYTAKVYSNQYYHVPENFTGQIRGIWATDPNDGGARVTELTA